MIPVWAPIVATLLEEDVQLTEVVRFCALPSPKVPVAVSCAEVSKARWEFDGVIAIDTRDEDVTRRLVLPVTPESCAEIVVLP
jgi:hypothetical protein